MIQFKSQLTKKEQEKVNFVINETLDIYRDFYLTRDNIRLFIKENIHLLFDNLKKGDKIIYDENGVAIVTGFSDKFKRYYVKILSKNMSSADKLLKVLFWNINYDLYCKIKRNNPLQQILKKNNFKFVGGRGKEILFKREYRTYEARNRN